MGAALALLASIAAIAFAAWPLMRPNQRDTADAAVLGELLEERDQAIGEIRELDFDRDLGNLSDEDHVVLREQSKRRAVAALKRLQAQESQIDQEIEQAIAALRASGRAPANGS